MEKASLKHPEVVRARQLQSGAGRRGHQMALLYGRQQVEWAVETERDLEVLFVGEGVEIDVPNTPRLVCSSGILKKISGTQQLFDVIGVVRLPPESGAPSSPLLVVFDGVVDPGNIGTIMRTAAAFGFDEFAATRADFDGLSRKVIQASRGAALGVRLQNFASPQKAIEALRKWGYQIVVTTPHQAQVHSLARLGPKPVALCLGSESGGVSQELLDAADVRIQIPMSGEMESLNVGVAAGITLYEMKMKLVLRTLVEKIQGSLGRNLGVAAQWMRQRFDAELKAATGLSAGQAIALMIAQCDGGGTTTILAQEARTDVQEVTSLQTQGLLSDDGHVTEAGEAVLAQVCLVQERVENTLLQGFSGSERQQLLQFLVRLQDNTGNLA